MRIVLTSAAALAVAACSGNDFSGSAAGPLDDSGLTQYVTVSTATPAVGDSMTVRSVVINTGATAAPVTLGCAQSLQFSGVGFTTTLDTLPTQICTTMLQLAPGDSLVASATTPPVTATPGDYVLSVQQILSPTWAVRVAVRVGAANIASH